MNRINENNMKKFRIYALLLAALLVLGAIFALSSCRKADAVDYNVTSDDKRAGEADAYSYFCRILPKDADAYQTWIAAYRGYNMKAEGFDDEQLEQMNKTDGINREGIYAVVTMLSEKATKSESKAIIAGFANADVLSDDVIRSIVEDLQTEVDLKAQNGLLDWVMYGIGWFLGQLTKIFGGYYAISIFIFALLIKIVFLPFAIKQQKTQIKSAKLQPKIALIRAKYRGRDDQVTMRKMQEEIMQLQQKEGASPMSGCLPMLIQLPFIIALYNIVIDPLRYVLGQSQALSAALGTYVSTARAAGGLGMAVSSGKSTISLLSMASGHLEGLKDFLFLKNAGACYDALSSVGIPNFNLFGVSLADTPSFHPITILVLIPIIAAFSQWLTMFLTKKWNGNAAQINNDPTTAQANASMKIMDLFMPGMTLVMTFTFSALLGLYWFYQSIIAILQAYLLNKFMPMPRYSEEEIKAIHKAQKEAEKAQRAAAKEQPHYKSLHYIDDDDYEDLPALEQDENKTRKKPSGQMELPEIKD